MGGSISRRNGVARPRLIGSSVAIRRLCRQILALGHRESTVLLQGESGTGKELTARLIHVRSGRADAPFVPVDCTTLRDTLFESQLFGHTRGAFTGADRATVGFYRAADGGTLFLDEIGELPPQSQAKLLRCIQERSVVPLGATEGIPANVRLIAATHRNLSEMVRRGEFRQDLYYRLNVARLRLPPLRERRNDIPLLVRHSLLEIARVYREPARTIGADAMDAIMAHDWPGNVRELVNAVEHAVVFCQRDSVLRREDFPAEVWGGVDDGSGDAKAGNSAAPTRVGLLTLEAAERRTIEAALLASRGNQSRAAQLLAIERHRLRRRILHHGLSNLVRPHRHSD